MKILLILAKKKILEKQAIKICRGALFHMKNRVSLKYFVNDCLQKQIFPSNLPKITSNLIFFSFNLQLEKLNCEKGLKFALIGNCFFRSFH